MVQGVDYWTVLVSVICSLIIIAGIVAYVIAMMCCTSSKVIPIHHMGNGKEVEGTFSSQNIQAAESIGAKVDSWMVQFFTYVAMFSAKHPGKTLLGMLAFAIILCTGITQLR